MRGLPGAGAARPGPAARMSAITRAAARQCPARPTPRGRYETRYDPTLLSSFSGAGRRLRPAPAAAAATPSVRAASRSAPALADAGLPATAEVTRLGAAARPVERPSAPAIPTRRPRARARVLPAAAIAEATSRVLPSVGGLAPRSPSPPPGAAAGAACRRDPRPTAGLPGRRGHLPAAGRARRGRHPGRNWSAPLCCISRRPSSARPRNCSRAWRPAWSPLP